MEQSQPRQHPQTRSDNPRGWWDPPLTSQYLRVSIRFQIVKELLTYLRVGLSEDH